MDWGDEDRAYWREYYGIARRWTPMPAVRRGCMIALVSTPALIAALFVGGTVVWLE